MPARPASAQERLCDAKTLLEDQNRAIEQSKASLNRRASRPELSVRTPPLRLSAVAADKRPKTSLTSKDAFGCPTAVAIELKLNRPGHPARLPPPPTVSTLFEASTVVAGCAGNHLTDIDTASVSISVMTVRTTDPRGDRHLILINHRGCRLRRQPPESNRHASVSIAFSTSRDINT